MTSPNHIIGGLVITGLFGSFLNLNILSNPLYIATTIFGSLLPDIDYPKSLIGRCFRPFSKILNRRFGHRTITHSIFVLFVSFLLLAVVENTFLHQTTISKIYFLGFFSHLVLDMMTVQGVPLFYPFLRNPCVLPGNPNARFKTGSFQSETLIFCFFLLSFIFLQPLFENGFWTQYNRYFGAPKHLASEFHKSNDALLVKYKVKRGTELLTGQGICIAAKESEIILLEKNGFHTLSKEQYTILEVLPEHTNQKLFFRTANFYNISVDNLNQLLQKHPIKQLDLIANQKFQYINNLITQSANSLSMEYPEILFFQELPDSTSEYSVPFFPNPKIKTLKYQIEQLKNEFQSKQNHFNQHQQKLKQLKHSFHSTISPTLKQKLFIQIQTLEKKTIEKPDFRDMTKLQTQLSELQQRDYISRKKQEIKNDLDNDQISEPTLFSGKITHILIN